MDNNNHSKNNNMVNPIDKKKDVSLDSEEKGKKLLEILNIKMIK